HRHRGDATLRPCGIDDGAPRHLQCQSGKPAGGEYEPDVDLRPSLRGEVDGHERSESGLHVGDAERKPVEGALAPARGRNRRLGRQRPRRRWRRCVASPRSLGLAEMAGCRCAGQGYLSGAAASLDGAAGLAELTTTTRSPRLYSGATRTWLRVRSTVIVPGFPPGAKFKARQSTAILRIPIPRKPPKSMIAARTCPSWLTMMSTIRPMSSPALLRTLLPRMVDTSWSSSTTAGVPGEGLEGGAGGAAVDGGFS